MQQTEGFMLAVQDQVIKTRKYRKIIFKVEMESDSCGKATQSIGGVFLVRN